MASATLTDEIQITSPLVVRNLKKGLTFFSDRLGDTQLEYTWAGAGDPSGLDEQAVSPKLLSNPQFLKVLTNGTLEVVDAAPAILKAIQKASETPRALSQRQQALRAQAAREEATSAPVVHPSDAKDFLSELCVGPGTRAGVTCGTAVVTGARSKGEKAPLCSQHEGMRWMAVYEETDKLDSHGKAIGRWIIPTTHVF